MSSINILKGSTEKEISRRHSIVEKLRKSPIPNDELLWNLGLYLNRQSLSRLLFMQELYTKIIDVHGVVMEFGVRWGQNLALFTSFRGIYEPFNYNRKIVGFDTFSGFPSVSEKDGSTLKQGDYAVTERYEEYLNELLAYHESESPISHKKKFELVNGDASKTIEEYLNRHPETIIALAYFDFDIYKPTKDCLLAIKERLTKGSVVAFDELNCPEFPGETLALQEVFGIRNIALKRSPLNPLISYFVVE